MRYLIIAVALALWAGEAAADLASDFQACKSETDSLKRLTCFDAISTDGSTVAARPAGQTKSPAPIKLAKATLRLQERDLSKMVFSSRVELIPTFKNETKKTVVAIEHTIIVTDAFGDKIIDGQSKLDIKIPPGDTIQSELYYSWEDNQFIQNEPFDKLLGPIKTGVAKAFLTVTKAVFSDGTTETY